MQLPGLDELESSVARATDELKRLKAENAELNERLQALGKEIDSLGTLVDGIGSGQKVDSKTKKRMGARLKSMANRVG
jgi:predicted nuclease with TOPRIM domain